MNNYTIKINGKYLSGYDYGELEKEKIGPSGWYTQESSMEKMLFSDKKENARLAEGNINLKSELDRVYDRMRYGDLKVDEILIERVNE